GGRAFDEWQELGFFSLVFLTQALERAGWTAAVEIDVVADHVEAVLGGDAPSPDRATLLGPCLVIPQEQPNVTCRFIDVDSLSGGPAGERVAASVLAELALDPWDRAVAYRNGRRWIRTFEPVVIEEGSDGPPRTRSGGH